MTAPLILARTFREAHRFAQDELGVELGHYRVVNSSGTIKAVRNTDLYLVPGWRNRPDRFLMQGAIKWCRLNVIDVVKWREAQEQRAAAPVPTEVVTPVPDGLQPPGTQLPLGDATDFFAEANETVKPSGPLPFAPPIPPAPEAAPEPEEKADEPIDPEPEVAPEPEKKAGRRRRRCKECSQLHYKEDPCPELEGE